MNEIDDQKAKHGFRWLQFSDIHVGIRGQSQLWPRFGTLLTDEIAQIVERVGGVDFVIFSGDLAQKGAAEEFDAFNDIINKIMDKIGTVQARPQIITVPGNHDLVRPDSLRPEAIALKQFWNNPALREGLWEDSGILYRDFLTEIFDNYSRWQDAAVESGLHLAPQQRGLLPGDASYQVATSYGEIGIAALNSTWLQLGAGDYKGNLHVDVRQLHQVTGSDPDQWARKCDASILLTHQPSNWLHSNFPATWDNDINPGGRFDLHLFGHMHEPDTAMVSHGGGPTRRSVQAASLFGMETFGDGSHQRIQGYSLHRVRFEGAERTLTSWPRRLIPAAGGRMKLAPDNSQDIDEVTGSFDIAYSVDERFPKSGTCAPRKSTHSPEIELAPASAFDLSAIRYSTAHNHAHKKVRRVEQESCTSGLAQKRLIWLAADWGLGHEGFITSVAEKLSVPVLNIYSLDFSDYTARAIFFDDFRTRFGNTFQQMCEVVSDGGKSIVVFDNPELLASTDVGREQDIEALAQTLSDFASETHVIIRSRRRPRSSQFPVVELKPLDEADVGVYSAESDNGGPRYSKPDAASKLFRHTDGIPARIDAALRDLEIMSLDDLVASNPDFGDTGGMLIQVPAALVSTVSELQSSDERGEQRAYELLLALAALPQGEQLSRIKRFLGPHPFGPAHARALLERSLIDTIALTTLDAMSPEATNKALIVPRTVRDYIRDTIDEKTSKEVDKRALDLYFGDKWSVGDIISSPTGKRVRQALCDGYEIQNASVLIVRSVRRAVSSGTEIEISGLIKLATGFIGILMKGDHFRSAVNLAEDMIRILEETSGYVQELNILRYEYARSLRMSGRIAEAKTSFGKLDLDLLSKQKRQSAELGLALCLESEGQDEAAAEAASRVIAIDKNSGSALQAKVIIAEQIEDETERRRQLKRYFQSAQRNGNDTLANNISLVLAKNASDHGEVAEEYLKQVLQNARIKGDFYNAARAIINLASSASAVGDMSAADRERLIEAYHYLYNERLGDLFDRCHAALWQVFEHDRDHKNLLNLFRHSSFIWRLSGRDAQEIKYLAKLTRKVKDFLASGSAQASRDGAYFFVRVTVVLGELPEKKKTKLQSSFKSLPPSTDK